MVKQHQTPPRQPPAVSSPSKKKIQKLVKHKAPDGTVVRVLKSMQLQAPKVKPQVDQRERIIDWLSEMHDETSFQFPAETWRKVGDTMIQCLLCPNHAGISTFTQAEWHCRSALHRQSWQLQRARQEIARLNALIKNYKNQNKTSSSQSKSIEDEAARQDGDQQQVIKMLTQIQQDISAMKRVAVQDSEAIKTTPWVELTALQELAACKTRVEMFELIQSKIKDQLPSTLWERHCKNYAYCISGLAKFMHGFRGMNTLQELADDLIRSKSSQLTKYVTAIRNFLTAFQIPEASVISSKQISQMIKTYKSEEETGIHMDWSSKDSILQTVYSRFYCAHPFTRLMFFISLYTGCRNEDLYGLTTKHFHHALANDKVIVFKDGKTKKGYKRSYLFPKELRKEMLRDSLMLGEDRPFVFGAKESQHRLRQRLQCWILVQEGIYSELKDYNIQRFHSFRATCLSIMIHKLHLEEPYIDNYIGWKLKGSKKVYNFGLPDEEKPIIRNKWEKSFSMPPLLKDTERSMDSLHQRIDLYIQQHFEIEKEDCKIEQA